MSTQQKLFVQNSVFDEANLKISFKVVHATQAQTLMK